MTRRAGGRRRALVGTIAVAVGVLGLLPASASAAADEYPVLTSIGVSPAVASPGSPAAIEAVAGDDVGLASIVTRWRNADALDSTSTYQLAVDAVTGRGAFDVAPSLSDGRWALDTVSLVDSAGHRATYHATGQLVLGPRVSTHTVDFGAAVTVSGATDRSGPVLEQVGPVSTNPLPGEEVEVPYRVTDSSLPLRSITFAWSALTNEPTTATLISAPASGTVRYRPVVGGHHALMTVTMVDAQGITTVHNRVGGERVTSGTQTKNRPNRLLDFAAADVGVRPGVPVVRARPRPGEAELLAHTLGLTGLRVEVAGTGRSVEVPAGPSDFTFGKIGGLPNGSPARLLVRGVNAYGAGPPVELTVTPRLSRSVSAVVGTEHGRRVDVIAHQFESLNAGETHWVYPTTGTGRFRSPRVPLGSSCLETGPGDLGVPGIGDILCVGPGGSLTALNQNKGGTTIGTRGWDRMRWVDGGFDLNGDRRPDVLAMNPAGDLVLYRQTTQGKLLAPVLVGRNWQSMISVVSAGDLNGDRRNDVVAVDAAGRLWLYPGTGTGKLGARRQIGSGWHTMGALVPMRDFDGDGKVDLGGITMGGDFLLYRGTGAGSVRKGVVFARGWQVFF